MKSNKKRKEAILIAGDDHENCRLIPKLHFKNAALML
jgi:hypothetical protein